MNLLDRAAQYLDKLDPAVSGSGGHAATYRACRVLCRDFGLSVDEAWPLILKYNERCEPPWNEKELRRKLLDAARRPDSGKGSKKTQQTPQNGEKYKIIPPSEHVVIGQARYREPTSPSFFSSLPRHQISLESLIERGRAAITSPTFFADISPFDPITVTPNHYLSHLFNVSRGEKTLIFSEKRSQGQCLWPDESGIIPMKSPDGTVFIMQPIDGYWRIIEGRKSRRHSQCVLSWRHALLESDNIADFSDWLSALAACPLPIISITFSGNKSFHVLLSLNAASHDEWLRRVDLLKPLLEPLKADLQALGNHLCMPRLPGAQRLTNGQWIEQQLVYFNPFPTGSRPLIEAQKIRDSKSFWRSKIERLGRSEKPSAADLLTARKAAMKYHIEGCEPMFQRSDARVI